MRYDFAGNNVHAELKIIISRRFYLGNKMNTAVAS